MWTTARRTPTATRRATLCCTTCAATTTTATTATRSKDEEDEEGEEGGSGEGESGEDSGGEEESGEEGGELSSGEEGASDDGDGARGDDGSGDGDGDSDGGDGGDGDGARRRRRRRGEEGGGSLYAEWAQLAEGESSLLQQLQASRADEAEAAEHTRRRQSTIPQPLSDESFVWEALHQELPFSDHGTGVQAAHAAAFHGKRPTLSLADEFAPYESLITRCWDERPSARPVMDEVEHKRQRSASQLSRPTVPNTYREGMRPGAAALS